MKKDNYGITFNNLNYLFDLNSRKLKPQISLLTLDLKKEYSEILSNENLDEIISLLETESPELIPVADIGFIYNKKSSVTKFLQWIINEGQQYNHEFGFLTLDKKQTVSEVSRLQSNLLTNN